MRYLIDSAGLGLDPSLVLDLFDDPAPAGEQLARLRDTFDVLLRERRDEGRPVADVLVYYVGHGQTDDQGHLSLLVRSSHRGMESETGIRASDLARVLKVAAPQQRRIVVLDCCFSEAAAREFIGMSATLDQAVAATAAKDLSDEEPSRGTLLMCSSPVGEVSIGPPNAKITLFSGAILEVLREGAEGYAEQLSFADIRDAAFEKMVIGFGANAPRPVLHQVNARKGDLTRVKVFPNRAFHFDAATHSEQADAAAREQVKRDVDVEQRSVHESEAREPAHEEHDAAPANDHQLVKPEAHAYGASHVNDAPGVKKDARSKLLLNLLSVVLFIVLAMLYIVFFSGHL
ncbi:caspase family protein [Burkholderia sp. 8Y]|uniref:caspase family protein n=1 Tax=Burkholderia sp. 8Y TaxID=2653133 RepID=UPI0013582FDA|nr:caspase family protein [Burkholderia sp. 8Y]